MAHPLRDDDPTPVTAVRPPNDSSLVFSSPQGLKFLHWICKLARNAREALVMAQSQLDDDDDKLEVRSSTFVDLQALAKCVANAVRDVNLLLTSAETYRKLYGQISVGGAQDKLEDRENVGIFCPDENVSIKEEMDPTSPFDAEADLADLALLFDDDYDEKSPKDDAVLALTENGVLPHARCDFVRAACDERDSDYLNGDDSNLNGDDSNLNDVNFNFHGEVGEEIDLLVDQSYDPKTDFGTKKNSAEYVGGMSQPSSSPKAKHNKKKKTKTTEQFPQRSDKGSAPFPTTASVMISATPDSSSLSSTAKTTTTTTTRPKPLTTRLEERFLNTSGTAKTEAWKDALLKKTLAQAAKAAGISTLIPMSAKSGVLVDRLTGQFHCEICGAKYRHMASLSRHRNIDHPRKKRMKKKNIAEERENPLNGTETGKSKIESKEPSDGEKEIVESQDGQMMQIEKNRNIENFSMRNPLDSPVLSPDIPLQGKNLPSLWTPNPTTQESSSSSSAKGRTVTSVSSAETPGREAPGTFTESSANLYAPSAGKPAATVGDSSAATGGAPSAASSAATAASPSQNPNFCDHCGISFENKVAMDKHLLAVMHEMVKSKTPVKLTESAKRNLVSKIRPKRIPRDGERRGADVAAEEEEEEDDDEVQVDFTADRECNICGKVFCNPQYMKEHRRRLHVNPGKKHECDICHQFYATPQGVRSHKEFMHGIKAKRKYRSKYYDPDDPDEEASDEEKEEILKCIECNKVYKHKISYQCHMQRYHSANVPDYCKKVEIVCPFCGEKRIGKYGLKKHIETVHEQKKRSKCHICGKEFSKKKSAQEHIDSVHLKLKNYTCEICGNKFVSDRNLHMHVQLVHLNIRKHKCEICGHGFSRRKALEVHIQNVHQGQTLLESGVS